MGDNGVMTKNEKSKNRLVFKIYSLLVTFCTGKATVRSVRMPDVECSHEHLDLIEKIQKLEHKNDTSPTFDHDGDDDLQALAAETKSCGILISFVLLLRTTTRAFGWR